MSGSDRCHRYMVVVRTDGETRYHHTHDLADAWRVSEQLGAEWGDDCVALLDLEAGTLLKPQPKAVRARGG